MDFFMDLLGDIILLIAIVIFLSSFSNLDSRVERLESYHSNVCNECGQVIED